MNADVIENTLVLPNRQSPVEGRARAFRFDATYSFGSVSLEERNRCSDLWTWLTLTEHTWLTSA
jgi:hypothetical protein